MNRRGFLKSILAAGVAPYVVTTAGVLMPMRSLWTPLFNGGLGFYEGVQWPKETLVLLESHPAACKVFGRALFNEIRRMPAWERMIETGLIAPAAAASSLPPRAAS